MVLERERATFVGHSLGGGVAPQVAYQFPELCERLVLVSSGRLGDEVHLALRAATLPGAELVLPLLSRGRGQAAARRIERLLEQVGASARHDVAEFVRGFRPLANPEARNAFVHTARAVLFSLTARQVLAVNLVTDALPAVAIAANEHDAVADLGRPGIARG
jgi:pimeloyl-ACP methyl ester carboxylesterase